MSWLLKSAIFLGVAPLFFGTLVYCAWRFTRWMWLETAGLIIIAAGAIAFITGVLLLLVHLRLESRVMRTDRKSLWPQAILVGGLLIINFPVAAFYTLSVIKVSTGYMISFRNDTNESIQNIVVTGPGVQVKIDAIAPGNGVRRQLHFHGDGSLDFVAYQQEVRIAGQIDGYVTSGLGGGKEVRIKAANAFEVSPALE